MNKKFVSRLIRDIVPSPVPRHPYISSRHSRTPSRHSHTPSCHSRESGNPEPSSTKAFKLLSLETFKPSAKRDHSRTSSRHSRESGNPEPSSNCANYAVPRIASSKGFTLLEVMVVTTILATLATTTLVTLNPTELLAQMRDSQRITTIGMLRDAVSLLVADRDINLFGGPPPTYVPVFISLPSIHQYCDDIVGLPTLPANHRYRCVTAANLTRNDGGGWIPLNFTLIHDGSPFTYLPVDPINTPASFYSYTPFPGGRATFAARIESIRQRTIPVSYTHLTLPTILRV